MHNLDHNENLFQRFKKSLISTWLGRLTMGSTLLSVVLWMLFAVRPDASIGELIAASTTSIITGLLLTVFTHRICYPDRVIAYHFIAADNSERLRFATERTDASHAEQCINGDIPKESQTIKSENDEIPSIDSREPTSFAP